MWTAPEVNVDITGGDEVLLEVRACSTGANVGTTGGNRYNTGGKCVHYRRSSWYCWR